MVNGNDGKVVTYSYNVALVRILLIIALFMRTVFTFSFKFLHFDRDCVYVIQIDQSLIQRQNSYIRSDVFGHDRLHYVVFVYFYSSSMTGQLLIVKTAIGYERTSQTLHCS